MTWQSDAIAIIQLVFTASMWPTIRDRRAQVPRWTSVITSCGMWFLVGIFSSLELWTAVGMSSLSATAWSFIAIWRPMKKEVKPCQS